MGLYMKCFRLEETIYITRLLPRNTVYKHHMLLLQYKNAFIKTQV
jgi:hypothetical protein